QEEEERGVEEDRGETGGGRRGGRRDTEAEIGDGPVSVGAAVLHGDAVAFAAHAVPRHGDGAVVVRQSGVLQHRHVPQEGVGTLLRLQTRTQGKDRLSHKTEEQQDE
ncbi:hypothetical protein INR49_008844, partial [Caranx melampygus]